MKQVTQIGVDVDPEELVCAMKRAGQRRLPTTFANTVAGHKKFIRWATKGARPARVCLEATGILRPRVCARVAPCQERGSYGGQPAGDQGFFPGVHAACQDRRGRRWLYS